MIQIQSPPAETDEETPRSGAEILLQIVNSLGDLCQIGAYALQKRDAEVAWLEERVHAARSEREELSIFTQGLQKLTDYLNDHLPMLEEGTLSGESPDLAEIQQAYEEAKSQAEELTQELEMTIFERDSLFEELQERSKSLAALERQARAWAAEAVDGAVFEDEALDDDEEALDAALDKDFAANLQSEKAQITELISDDSLVADLLDEEESVGSAASLKTVSQTEDDIETEIPFSKAASAELETNEIDSESADEQVNEELTVDVESAAPAIEHMASDANEDENDALVLSAADLIENAAHDGDITPSNEDEHPQAEPTDISHGDVIAVAEAEMTAEDEHSSTHIDEGESEFADTLAALKDELLGDEYEDEDQDNNIEFADSVPTSPDPDDARTPAETENQATSKTRANDETDGIDVACTELESTDAESTDEPERADAEDADKPERADANANDTQTEADKTDETTTLAAAPVDDLLPAEVLLDDADEFVAQPSIEDEEKNAAAVDEDADAVVAENDNAEQKSPSQDVPAPIAPAPLLLDDLDDFAASHENDEVADDPLENESPEYLQVHALPALLEGKAFSENEMRFASILSSRPHSIEEVSEKLGLGLDETRKQIDTLLKKGWIALRSDES